MAFDTTYYFTNASNTNSIVLTIPGGVDTSIYISPGLLPSDINAGFTFADSIVRQANQVSAYDTSPAKHYTPDAGLIFIFVAVFGFIIYKIWKDSKAGETYSETVFTTGDEPKPRSYFTYYGDELNFSDQQLTLILKRRFPYYLLLSKNQQTIFIERLQKFIAGKTFKIHSGKGLKEMPVLVSAAAIQLTFGLKKYLLPHFEFIHIHPQEFLRVRPILCFLEGNVSGHSINLSWKHFLEGYANATDGQNVGLHELSHALYYQTFVVEENEDSGFKNLFSNFNIDGNKAFNTEKTVTGGLYSEYAEKNFQEFWAESVEIFFEKPAEMISFYPQLYQTMKLMLKQDPVNKIASMEG